MCRLLGFVLRPVVLAIWLALSSRAAAQCEALPGIEVQGSSACVTDGALRERLVAYAPRCGETGLLVSVQLTAAGNSAEIALSRGGQRLSSRRFEQLPDACSEQRDMLALSIALAIEHLTPQARARPNRLPLAAAGARRESKSSALDHSPQGDGAAPASSALADPPPTAASSSPGLTRDEGAEPASEAGLRSAEAAPPAAPRQPEPLTPPLSAADARDRSSSVPQPTAAGESLAMHLYAGGQGVLFALPAPIWLGALGLELRFGSASVQLGGLAGVLDALQLGRGSVHVNLAGGELYGCEGAGVGELHAQLCLGGLGAGLQARGAGYAPDRVGNSAWAAAALVGAVRWPREAKLALQLSVRGLYSFVRPKLVVQGAEEQAVTRALGASARIELIFRIL